MARLIRYHKTLCILLMITILSLMDTSGIEPRSLVTIPYFDKIVHFIMYFTLAFTLMFEYYLHHKYKITKGIQVLILPLIWGAIMEIAQFLLTNYRGAEWKDMLANTVGIIIAYFTVKLLKDNRILVTLILFPFFKKPL